MFRIIKIFRTLLAAGCTEENIIHLVDFLLSDRIIHAIGIYDPDFDTVAVILCRLISFCDGVFVVYKNYPFRQLSPFHFLLSIQYNYNIFA